MKKAASIFLAISLACSAAQSAHKPKISPDAASADLAKSVRVIIQWECPIGSQTTETVLSAGGKVLKEFASVRQGIYLLPGIALSTLETDPTVKYVSLDRQVKHKLATAAATINAPQVWNSGYTGAGIGVAVLDSGINKDDNLGVVPDKEIVFTDDFTPGAYVNGKKSPSFGLDWFGHGEHVAGVIASNGKASSCTNCFRTMTGIAPGATLINLKVLDSFGEGSDSQVIAAIDEAISLRDTYKIRVLNLSLGRPVFESYAQDPLCQAVEAAWRAGIVVVVAAGNDGRDNSANNQGYGTILAPANDPSVITVGAMKSMNTSERIDDLIASYSSKGPTGIDHVVKPDLVAPGNLIVSLMAQHGTMPLTNPKVAVTVASIQGGNAPSKPPVGATLPNNRNQQPPQVNFGPGYSPKYNTLSGTSMASAVVSGAVADLLQAMPTLTPDQVKILLMRTGSKNFPSSSVVTDDQGNILTAHYDVFTVGAGYLDLQAAIAGAGSVPTAGNSLSPISSYDPNSGLVLLSFDSQSAWMNPGVWSDRSLWGVSAVWSSSVLMANQAVWDARSLWGVSSDTASRSLWGARSLWGVSDDQSASMNTAESVLVLGEN